jgi:hypothetical protein
MDAAVAGYANLEKKFFFQRLFDVITTAHGRSVSFLAYQCIGFTTPQLFELLKLSFRTHRYIHTHAYYCQ